jgi:hypothetical protein
VVWLNVDIQDERYRDMYGAHRTLVDRAASGMQDTWTAAAWLSSKSLGVAKYAARALLGGACPIDELAAVRALGAATASEAALAERLRAGGLVEALAAAILPELQKLVAAGAVTGVELHGKFVQEGKAFTMQYGDLSTFFGGLEAKIGAPNPKVRETMEREHTNSSDSQDEFTAGNYGVKTTPQKEWWFVVEPDKEGVKWPVEEKLRGTAEGRSRMRVPMPLAMLLKRLGEVNTRLEKIKEPKLELVEGFGARLYTGPMCAARRTQPARAYTRQHQHICARDLHTTTSPPPHHHHLTTHTPSLFTTCTPPAHRHLTTYTPPPHHLHTTTSTPPQHLHTTSPLTHHLITHTPPPHHLRTTTLPPTHHNLTTYTPPPSTYT